MKVDCHLHLKLRGLSEYNLIHHLEREGLDGCWLLTWEENRPGPWGYVHLPVERVLEAYHKHPHRIVPMYAPDPLDPQALRKLEYWHEQGVRGCGELKSTARWSLPQVRRLLDVVQELGLPLLFHMEDGEQRVVPLDPSLSMGDRVIRLALRLARKHRLSKTVLEFMLDRWYPRARERLLYVFPGYMLDFSSLEKVLQHYPGINFVGHGPLFWKHISSDAVHEAATYPRGPVDGQGITCRLLREYSNLYADLSAFSGFNALQRDHAFARRFLDEHQDKILYGTDNIELGLEALIRSLGLSPRIYRKVLGENACRLVNP